MRLHVVPGESYLFDRGDVGAWPRLARDTTAKARKATAVHEGELLGYEENLDQRLICADAAGYDLQQIVIPATDQVAFDDLVHFPYRRLEASEILAPVIGQRDLGEHHDELAELHQIDMRHSR